MKKGNTLPKRKKKGTKTYKDYFPERLEEMRKRRGETQQQFCKFLGVNARSYRGWINGATDYDKNEKQIRKRVMPEMETIITICDKLGVSIDYLFGRSRYETADNDLIGKRTGLNDEAIDTLKALACVDIKHNERFMTVVNHFLSADNIDSLIWFIRFFTEFALPFVYSVPVMKDSNGLWKKIDIIALAGSEKNLDVNKELDINLIPSLTKARAQDMLIKYIDKIASGYVAYAISQGIVDENYIIDNARSILLNAYNDNLPE